MPVKQAVWNGSSWYERSVVTPPNLYRPIQVSSIDEIKQKFTIPDASSASFVMWPYPGQPQAADLYTVCQTLAPNAILVLPEAAQSYLVDSSNGFVNDASRYYEMARCKRGVVGMGPGTRIEIGPSSFSRSRQLSTEPNSNSFKVLNCSTANGYFGNFEMRGRDLGGVAYHALCHTGANSVFERLYMNAAHRGFRNSPNGESGAMQGYGGTNQKILNCEIECRDATGTRVATSPYMFNQQSNVTIQDVYAHHAVAGMPTFWRVNGGTVTRVRSEYNGSGVSGGSSSYEPSKGWGLSGSCFNFELCSGTFYLNDCTFICNYQNNYGPTADNPTKLSVDYDYSLGGNVGGHLGGGSNEASSVFYVSNPTFDYGSDGPYRSGGQRFDLDWQATYDGDAQVQKQSDFHITDASGTPLSAVKFRETIPA